MPFLPKWRSSSFETAGPNGDGYYTAGIDFLNAYDNGTRTHHNAIEIHSKDKTEAEQRRDLVMRALSAPAVSTGEPKIQCDGLMTCAAAKFDGVTCPDDTCDFDIGVRSPPVSLPAAKAAGEIIPVGWKLVPIEPSQEMVRAAYAQQTGAINVGFAEAYRKMVETAPAAPQASGDVRAAAGICKALRLERGQ